MEPTFIDSVRQKILYVHNYNMKVTKVTFAYPFSNEFVELLIQYVLVEFRALYRRQDHISVREVSVQDRVLRILMHIFNAFFESRMVPPKEIFEKSAKAIINIFIEIKRDYGVNNKLMENMTIKLLKRAGLFEKIEALKGKNLPCPLDTFLTDHAYSDIYKTTITSDYGTDDGFQMDEGIQIVDDDIVDITASESNKIKEEDDNTILNKASTSPLTKSVLTICLDDSDFDSDEETCCFTEEVKTSKKSLEFQRYQRQEDKVSFHKRNHKPMDEVKTEAIKLDISEEYNFSKTNSKPVNSDVSHSEATLISKTTIGIKCDGIQYHNQSNIKTRNMTKSATVETEIVEISDEENEVELYDPSNITNPSSKIRESVYNYKKLESSSPITVEDDFELDLKVNSIERPSTSIEMNDKLKMADQQSISNCQIESEDFQNSSLRLISKDDKLKEKSLMDIIEKIPEQDPGSQSEVKGSNKDTSNDLDSARSAESHDIEKIASSTDLHDSEIEEISVAECLDADEFVEDKISKDVKIEEQLLENSETSSHFEESNSAVDDVDCAIEVIDVNHPETLPESVIYQESPEGQFKISDTSTTHTDTLTTENLTVVNVITDEIETSNSGKHRSDSVEDTIPKGVEIEEQLLGHFESSSQLKENKSVVDVVDCTFEVINNNQPEPPPESIIRQESPENVLFEIRTNEDSLDIDSKKVTDGTLEFINLTHQDRGKSVMIDNNNTSIDSEEKNDNLSFSKPVIDGTDSNEDNALPQASISNENQDDILSKDNLYTEISEKVISNGLEEMGSHISLKPVAHDIKYSSSLQEPNQVKLSPASLPNQKVSEKNLGNVAEAITDPTLQSEINETSMQQIDPGAVELLDNNTENNVLEGPEIDVKASLQDFIENSSWQPNDEIISQQNDKEKPEDVIPNDKIIDDTLCKKSSSAASSVSLPHHEISRDEVEHSEIPGKQQPYKVHEEEYSGAIMDKPQKSCTQENVGLNLDRTFSNDGMAEDQKPTEIIEEAFLSTQPLEHITLLKESNIDRQLFNNDPEFSTAVEVGHDETQSALDVKHIIPNVPIDSHDGKQKSCIENVESNIDKTSLNQNSDHSNELAENKKPVETTEGTFQSTQLFQSTIFNTDSEFANKVEVESHDTQSELDVEHIIPNVSIVNNDDEQKFCTEENVDSNINSTFPNQNSDQSDELVEDEKSTEIIEEAFQNTQSVQDTTLLEGSNNDEQFFNKDSEFANEVEVESHDTQSELDVEHIIPNVSIVNDVADQKSFTQENVKSNIIGTCPVESLDHSNELAEDQKPTEITEEVFQNAQPLQDTTLLEGSSNDEQFFNKDSEFANEVEVESHDTQSELNVEHIIPNVSIVNDVAEQKSFTQENVKSNIGTFPIESLDHSDELAEDQKPTEITEEAFQNAQSLQGTTLPEESNIDEHLLNESEVEVGSDDVKSELNVKQSIPNVSIDSHEGEQKSCIQENIKLNIDGTFHNESSEIKNEIVESARQSIQGNCEINVNKEETNQEIPLSVEYATTNIKECGEESGHKVEEKAEIGENPTALARDEDLFHKPNELLFVFHDEYADEVEIGTEATHSDADINNIGELCVTDQDKTVQSDSLIENQPIKSATVKRISGSPNQNVWRPQENLHISIITESHDLFGQQDSGIASNSGSSAGQSLQADLESEVDFGLRLKMNEAVPQEAFYPLDVLAGVAAEAPREIVIEEQKPLRRGRSSKAENENASELFEKVMFNQKEQTTSSKVSKCKNKIEQSSKPRTHQTTKKVIKTLVTDNIRVTRSSHLKNSNENGETSFKPHDFLSVKKSIPPANKMYADRVVDINVTSEDSNDSESNNLMIDEGASAKSKDIKSEPLLGPLSKDKVIKHINEAEEVNTKSKDMKSEPLQDQFGEYEVRGVNYISKMSHHQIQVDGVDKNNSEDIVKAVEKSIYDEDSLDEELHFCYEPNLEPKISLQQNEDFNFSEPQQFLPRDEKVVSISTFLSASVENSKTSLESSKPFRTKAERKAYNQQGPNPYISIERLHVSTTENNVPIENQNWSKSFDIGILKNIESKSKRQHSKENLKHPSNIEVEPEGKTIENTESVMLSNIKEDVYKNELTEDNIPFAELTEKSERKANELGDFDETPLAERIKKEAQECLAETSLPEEIAIKSKQKSKRLKTKWKKNKKKGSTKINKISGPNVQEAYKVTAKPISEKIDNSANKNILLEKKTTAVFQSLSTTDCKKVDDIQIKFENLEENSNRNYYTLPKLRRKSISKDNLSRSVSSATILISTGDIKDEDVKCMPPPKLRGKSSASSERFKEQNTKLKWKCKNTVSQTTEKLLKKLCEEVAAVTVDKSLLQKPLVDTVQQSPYEFCERNLAISDLPPESSFTNLVNPLSKKENSSDGILIENSAKVTREDSLYENNDKSNDIVYDLSLKPHRDVPNMTDNEKCATATVIEEIPIITEHKNLATVDKFTEQEKDKGKLPSSSNEKLIVHTSNLVSTQIPEDVQKDDVSTESKQSLEVESIKPDIDHVDIVLSFNLPSCPSEDVADILSKPEKKKPSIDCNPEILEVEHKYLDELSSPSKKKLETVVKRALLTDESITSAIVNKDYTSKKKLKDLNDEAFKNVIDSAGRNEAEECEETHIDIAKNLSQKNLTSISHTPDLTNESNKISILPDGKSEGNIKSDMKTKLGKRKNDDSSESSKQKKKQKSRNVETSLNVAPPTTTLDSGNSTDTIMIKAIGSGFEGEKTEENEDQTMKTDNSLEIRRMQIKNKQKVLLFPLDASKSPPRFVNNKSKKLHYKKTDGISDEIEGEVAIAEIKDEVSHTKTESTPESNVCLDFFSKTSKSESDSSIQEVSPIVEKQVQSEESTIEVPVNSGKINEDWLVSLDEHISTEKSFMNLDSKSHSSGRKKIDGVKIVKQKMQDVHITKNAKRKFRPRSKSEAHTAKDGGKYIGCELAQNSYSRSALPKASKIVSEMKKAHGEKIKEIIQVSDDKPLQKISKKSLSKSCTNVDGGMDDNLKKLTKTSSKLQPRTYSNAGIKIVKENSKKSAKENCAKETRLSLISRSEFNIQEDILEVDGEKIMKGQNNESAKISKLFPLIEEESEKSEASCKQVQNIYVQKPDSDKIVTIADTAMVTSQEPHTEDLKNSCVQETEKIHSSNNTNKEEVICYLRDGTLLSTDVSMKNDQEFCSEILGRSCRPDNTNNTTPEASLEAKYSVSDGEETSHDLDNYLANSQISLHQDQQIICDHNSGEKNLKENIHSFSEISEMSDIHALDRILQNSKDPQFETSTKDSSLIMESESISVSNEIELGRNVVEEKSITESVDIHEVANTSITVTENDSTIDESRVELTVNTENSQLFSDSKDVEADVVSHFLKSESVQIIDGKSGIVANIAPLIPDSLKEEIPIINRDDFLESVQDLGGTEVDKMNVPEEISLNTDLPNTCKRKRIIPSEPHSEKPADECNAGMSSMRELTILIDNSNVVTKSSLSESPRKRERKSIESVVNHLKEKENFSSIDSTIPVTVESVKSNWVSSIEEGCDGVSPDFNSPLWLKSDEIHIHSEVVVSSDQPALISSSMSQESYTHQNIGDASCTMKYNLPINQEALGKTTANNEQVSSRNVDLKPLHSTPDNDMFGLGDFAQSTDIEASSMTSNLSEESSSAKAIQITNLSPAESSANDANVEETFQNLANLSHFGKAAHFKMQTNASPFVCPSIVHGNGGNDKHDFVQMMSAEPTADHNASEIRQPETLTSVYNSSLSRNKDTSKFEHYTGYTGDTSVSTSNSDSKSERLSATTIKSFNNDNSTTSDISLNYHDISPCKMSLGSTPTLDLISTQNYQLTENILGQISRVNNFITGDSGSPNDITDIIPVSKQADFSHSFKNTYEGNNSDHSYYNNYNTADPVMSIAGEDIFPKDLSDASSELLSNDNPLRDFELSDDFSEFLNTKEISEEKDSEEKDSESNQNDDYKLRIENETITNNLVDMSRSRQSKEIIKLYGLIDADKMEPDYITEPSREHGLWFSIIESDQSTQKVIVLPNNHCPTSPVHMTHNGLLENDQSTQKGILEPNNDCLTPTFHMSDTDLYNSFDVSPPRPHCYNPMPPVKSESAESSSNERMCTGSADSENNSSTLGTSKKDPKKDCPGDMKKPKMTKRSVPRKIEKDQKGVQPDILPTRSYARTKPSQWIKRSNQVSINNSKADQSSSYVEKQDPNADSSSNSSKEVISTDNLLELPVTKSTRILPKKPIVIQGFAPTKTTEIASTRIANTPSVGVKEQTKTNVVKVSKSLGKGLSPRLAQDKVTPLKHDHKLTLQKLSDEYKLGEVTQNFSSASMKDLKHDAVVPNIADNVKSRKRVPTNLYSSRPLTEENVKNSSHNRPKRKKTSTELNFNGKLTGHVNTNTAVSSTGPVARVVESDKGRRSQSRGSSRSSVEPTSEPEDPLRKRFKIDEKTPQDLYTKPAGSKYPVNYSIERILGKDNNSANESRHSNEGPVKDCREREGREFTRNSSGTGNKSESGVGKTEGSVLEDEFDRLIRHKNETPSYPHREHSTLRENRYHKPDPAYRSNERGFNIEKSRRERIPRDGSTRVTSALLDQRLQERDSRAGNKRYPTYQVHPPEQRRSSGGHYPSAGSSRHGNYRQYSGVSSSRSNVSQPSSSTSQQNSRSSMSSPRDIIDGEDHKWAANLIDRGLLRPLSESPAQFFPPKSPRDK